MRNRFVPVDNVVKFTDAVKALDTRGAAEKQIVLISGEAGLGKSKTALWWALKNDAIQVCAKPTMSPHWLLTDLLKEMNKPAGRRTPDAFAQAVDAVLENPRPIVLDEVEDVLADGAAALDTVRKLVDLVEVPLILVGRERTPDKIMRQPQIASRVAGHAEFRPLSIDDVRLMADELVEGDVADDLVAEAHRQSRGYVRDCMTAIATIDAACRRKGKAMAAADFRGRWLCGPLSRGARAGNVLPFGMKGAADG